MSLKAHTAGTSPASSARTPGRRGATRPSRKTPVKPSTHSRRKSQPPPSGSGQSTAASKAGSHLPQQGSADELRDAALASLQWEPVEGHFYQMNLHRNTPPWYDFTIFIRGHFICILPEGDWGGIGTMHASVVSRAEWLEKMAGGRIRRKPNETDNSQKS